MLQAEISILISADASRPIAVCGLFTTPMCTGSLLLNGEEKFGMHESLCRLRSRDVDSG